MVDPRFIYLLLERIPREALLGFAAERIPLKGQYQRKRDLVKYLTTDYQLTPEDIEELEDLVAGNPTDRGFNVFLYELLDLPSTSEEMLDRISKTSSIALIAPPDKEDETAPLIVNYSFEETAVMQDEKGNLRLAIQPRSARLHLFMSEKRAEAYVGSMTRAQRVVDDVTQLLKISFRRKIRHDFSAFSLGSLDPVTAFFLELLYNRLSKDGLVENVENIMLDSSGVEARLRNIQLRGNQILASAQTCKLLLQGQKIIGIRFLYRVTMAHRNLATYVTLMFNEAGLKITVARQNLPSETVGYVFNVIRFHYETLVDEVSIDRASLQRMYQDMTEVANQDE